MPTNRYEAGSTMAAEWYYRVMGAEFGPVSANELVEQAADRKISPDTEVRKGDGAWVPRFVSE